ncbi:hypothetical protein CDD80_2231 [Ophiocordyceps camponoti-rufipedis]|uniref:Uncharacterized protein n=1 Tax=Ophiocordyceps camponoti-rufipedis TaxID=2004952 RepID=A0A2C5Z3M1_9HYPO|nr:hypothetical protein CDD80_2231 [Ophiocordyceps camponoti-rufipedis]
MMKPVAFLPFTLLTHVTARATSDLVVFNRKDQVDSTVNSTLEARDLLLGGVLLMIVGGAIGGMLVDIFELRPERTFSNEEAALQVDGDSIVVYEKETNNYIRIDGNHILDCGRRVQNEERRAG